MPDTDLDDVPLEEVALASEVPAEPAIHEAPTNGSAVAPPAPDETRASAPPTPSGTAMIARLRAEAEATEDPTRKAVLLHEAAELEERAAGDELGAAREYLASFNLDAGFREPLEALVRILERRRSLKNLGRVLENLYRAADTPDERARALRARAADAVDVNNDRNASRDFLEQAIEADPEDAASWLMLEIDAAMRGDPEGRKRALARRVELATDPRWASLLRVDLADLRAGEGDVDDALDILTEVVSSPGEAAWRACTVAERLARTADRGDREAWALSQRGEIVLESLQDPLGARGNGVPTTMRLRGVAADAFVRAAAAYRSVGRIEDEVAMLERALAVDPEAAMPHLARIAAATRLGDLERAAALAKELVERGGRPELSPYLWLTVAEGALATGDREAVLEACGKMMEATNGAGVVPRTLLSDLLLDGSDPQRLATMIEGDAAARPTDEGKARGFLEAAVVHSIFAGDGIAARAALTEAVASGADPRMVARIGRALALTTPTQVEDQVVAHDPMWFEDASRRLRATAADATEAADVDLDLARARLQRGDRDGAKQALEAMQADSPRALVSKVMRVALGGDAAGDALLAELSAGNEGDAAVAFAVARAMRAMRTGDEPARSAALDALAAASEGDEVAALVRAATKIADKPTEAAEVLRELSRASSDPNARDVLRVAAALLCARAGAIDVALEASADLETDAVHAIAPARAVWQRIAARGDDDARRTALQATARDVMSPGGWSALEQLADRIVAPNADGDAAGAEEILASLTKSADPALGRAALLLEAAWPDETVAASTKEDAILSLEALGGDAQRLVARASLRKAHRDADSAASVAAAEAWHRAGGGVPAAIEMLVGAEASADSEAEVRGRTALASSLEGAASQLVAASASIAAHVAGMPAPPLPTTRDPETSASIALAAFELAPPGSDPVRRERALRDLADAEDSASTWIELAGWSAFARGDHEAARGLFAKAIESAKQRGESTRSALEGGVEAELAIAGGKPSPAWAEWVEKLARELEAQEDAGAANLWETVGHAWWDQIGDAARGEYALNEAFRLDSKRRRAFERVFRAVRARKEDDRLLDVVSRRLEATDDPPEMAKLFWEQARVLFGKGDAEGALGSLENVTMLEPDHVGALALSATIYVTRQMYEEAAKAFDTLSRCSDKLQQKTQAALGAADLYEKRLNRPAAAVDVLVALDKLVNDPTIHERIAAAAEAAEDWSTAAAYYERLIDERKEAIERIDAARKASTIRRDKLGDAKGAIPALLALLAEAPGDRDAIEFLLDAGAPMPLARDVLRRCLSVVRADLVDERPTDVRSARIVSRIAAILGDKDLQQISIGVLGVLDVASDEERKVGAQLVARLGQAPAVALDRDAMARLVSPDEPPQVVELFRVMATTIAEAFGPTLETLGVGRKERVDARAGSALRNEVAAWAGAFGIGEFDFFHGGKDPRAIQGVPGEVASIVVGGQIQQPLSLEDRARLVREVVALSRGTTCVLHRDDVGVGAIVVASCAIAEIRVNAPAYAVLAETQRLLTKAISRKTKKVLPDVAAVAARTLGGHDPRTFRAAALRTLDRAAVVAAGEPNAALAQVGMGSVERQGADARAEALLRFVWGDDYLALRRQLGLGIG